jgi:hypothetical protein
MTNSNSTSIDVGATIAPKSDQLNADDLIVGPRTITLTAVKARASTGQGDQPIALHFDGDNGKPYLPCKSMRRVLVHVWGRDGAAYVGRSLTLFRDESVVFGGAAVGGIRISHMSEMTRPVTLSLTASKASRKPYVVQPLATAKPAATAKKTATAEEKLAKAQSMLGTILLDIAGADDVDAVVARHADMVARIVALIPDAADQVATAANDAKKD